MKIRTLIATTALVLLCAGLNVCVAQEASAPASAPSAAPKAGHPSTAKPKHHRKHHHARQHAKHPAQKEFTEQQLQEMQAQSPPSK